MKIHFCRKLIKEYAQQDKLRVNKKRVDKSPYEDLEKWI